MIDTQIQLAEEQVEALNNCIVPVPICCKIHKAINRYRYSDHIMIDIEEGRKKGL